MKKQSRLALAILLMSSVALPFGCTKDKAYTKEAMDNVDPEFTFFSDGASLKCSIEEQGDAGTTSFTIPSVSISKPNVGNIMTGINVPAEYAGQSVPASVVKYLHIGSISSTSDFKVSTNLPAEIKDVKEADITADISVDVYLDSPLAYIPAGFVMYFPKGVTAEKKGTYDYYDVAKQADGRYAIVTNKGIQMSTDHKVFAATLTKLDFTVIADGTAIKDGKIDFTDQFAINGELQANYTGTAANVDVPGSVAITATPTVSDITVNKASVKVAINQTVNSKEVKVDIPKELKEQATVTSDNPKMVISVKNESPLAFLASARIVATRNDVNTQKVVEVTNENVAAGTTEIVIDKSKYPGIVELITFLPDVITISDIKVNTKPIAEQNYVEVAAESHPSVAVSYKFDAELIAKFEHGIKVNIDGEDSKK